jgi:ATP-dependent DNA helicase RecQ
MPASAEMPLESHLARFRLSSFRPGQREVISALLAGQDCLCIMPTGGGKSLCYQLPSVARQGLTLVVSPLIALMKDQVDSLTALGIAATYINSSLSPAEAFDRMNRMAAGQFDLVYIAPERLRSSLFLEKLRETHVQLLAVDEAHCISEWGHDFRPDYARLGRLRQRLNNPQTIALTATATPDVRRDIALQLELREPQEFITGFSRPNLSFEVQQPSSDPDRDRMLMDFLRETPGAGIVYSATRKGCEALAPLLSKTSGRKVDLYHAGLEPDARRRVQDEFMSGRTPIIVATNAFGMGIDKSDLRFVVHYNIPGTLEAYYQEAGRAGRDGKPSRCLLLYATRDRRIQEFFIDSAYPEPEIVEEVYDFLRAIDADPIELTLDEIRERLNLPIRSEGVSACEKLLEKCGAVERLDARQNMAAVRIDSDLPTLVDLLPREAKVQRRVLQAVEKDVGGLRFERVYISPRRIANAAEIDLNAANRALRELSKLQAFDFVPPFRGRAVHMVERTKPFDELGIDFDEQQRRKAAEYAKLDRMVRYAASRSCRQLEILDYFGDPQRQQCGACDNCRINGATTSNKASGVRQHPDNSSVARTDQSHREADASRSPESELAPQILEAVRIVLSGVARMKGRFGKQMLARMLIGSKAKEIAKLKLDKLSTFGLLNVLKEPQALSLINALLEQRLLMQVEETPHRPLVRLTPRGEEVMKGQATLADRLNIDDLLHARLLSIRPDKPPRPARATGGQPQPVAERQPRVADPFDDANAELAAGDDEGFASADVSTIPPAGNGKPPYYWTWRVFTAGFSLDEVRQIRNLDRAALIEQLLAAAREGCAVDAGWIFTPDQERELRRLLANGNTVQSANVRLPGDIPRAEAELFLTVQQAKAGVHAHQP